MKTTFPLVLLAASLCFVVRPAAAEDVIGSGHVVSETRNVGGFHGIDLRGSGRVVVTQGDGEGLVIDAEDNLLPLLESSVSDGVLRLGFKPHPGGYVEARKDIVYHVQLKTLDRLAVNGSGDITADALHADALDIAVNGSGNIKLGGEVRRETVGINGSGNLAARDLKAADATVTVNGSGDASVQADKTLMATINGSGEISYSGHPAVVKNVHGSGEVHPVGAKNEDGE